MKVAAGTVSPPPALPDGRVWLLRHFSARVPAIAPIGGARESSVRSSGALIRCNLTGARTGTTSARRLGVAREYVRRYRGDLQRMSKEMSGGRELSRSGRTGGVAAVRAAALIALTAMLAFAASAQAAPAAPSLVALDKINSGDTAWMLTSTALVLMMTVPGLALFYAGMVRKKNVLATLMQSFAITCLVTVLWWAVGYSLAFTPGSSPFIGGLSRVFFNGMVYLHDAHRLSVSHLAPTIPEGVYAMFQGTFAIITPALICGAFAERMKFSALLWFMGLWLILVYCPVAHWMWEPSGWLAATQLDFAGGTVVHINAGIAGLATALMLGKRRGLGRESMAPHNLTLTVIGASLLWVGWFGFNAGSAVASDGRAAMAFVVTQIATAVAALAWMFTEWLLKGKPSVLGICSGAVAGLVAITPASGFVTRTGRRSSAGRRSGLLHLRDFAEARLRLRRFARCLRCARHRRHRGRTVDRSSGEHRDQRSDRQRIAAAERRHCHLAVELRPQPRAAETAGHDDRHSRHGR